MVSNADLRRMYRQANTRFFDNKLPQNLKVRFGELADEGADGIFEDNSIEIAQYLRATYALSYVVLLHEMVHAELEPTYQGYAKDGGHGMRFQARLVELFEAGAYDGFL